jgi:hypothetical protein
VSDRGIDTSLLLEPGHALRTAILEPV